MSAVDKNGCLAVTADDEIRIIVEGAGEFLGAGNGNPASHENDKVPVRRLFNGMMQIIIRPAENRGRIKVRAYSNSIAGAELVIDVAQN